MTIMVSKWTEVIKWKNTTQITISLFIQLADCMEFRHGAEVLEYISEVPMLVLVLIKLMGHVFVLILILICHLLIVLLFL